MREEIKPSSYDDKDEFVEELLFRWKDHVTSSHKIPYYIVVSCNTHR